MESSVLVSRKALMRVNRLHELVGGGVRLQRLLAFDDGLAQILQLGLTLAITDINSGIRGWTILRSHP